MNITSQRQKKPLTMFCCTSISLTVADQALEFNFPNMNMHVKYKTQPQPQLPPSLSSNNKCYPNTNKYGSKVCDEIPQRKFSNITKHIKEKKKKKPSLTSFHRGIVLAMWGSFSNSFLQIYITYS